MQLNYETARRLEGEIVRFRKENGEWSIGKVVKVRKDGLEILEQNEIETDGGYGFGFWGPGPWFVPFGVAVVFPFFWW